MIALPIGASDFSLECCELEPQVGGGESTDLVVSPAVVWAAGARRRVDERACMGPCLPGAGGGVDSHPSLVEPLVDHEASQANYIIGLNN